MKYLIISISIFTLSISCTSNAGRDDFPNNEELLVEQIEASDNIEEIGLQISEDLLTQIKKEVGKPFKAYSPEVWYYYAEDDTSTTLDSAIFFDKVSELKGLEIFDKYHKAVEAEGNYLFMTEMDFDEEYNTYYDIAIMPAKDQFDALRIMAPDGINYDIYTEDIITQMRIWNEKVGFEICQIDFDYVGANMTKVHPNLNAFCNEVYDFCPDVIDQGYDDLETMEEDYRVNKYFWLWWD